MRLQILQRDWFKILFLAGILSIVTAMTLIEAPSASAAAAVKKSKQTVTSAETTAQRYAEAMGAGNRVDVGRLDFACQYPLVAAAPPWHQDLSDRLRPSLRLLLAAPTRSPCPHPCQNRCRHGGLVAQQWRTGFF